MDEREVERAVEIGVTMLRDVRRASPINGLDKEPVAQPDEVALPADSTCALCGGLGNHLHTDGFSCCGECCANWGLLLHTEWPALHQWLDKVRANSCTALTDLREERQARERAEAREMGFCETLRNICIKGLLLPDPWDDEQREPTGEWLIEQPLSAAVVALRERAEAAEAALARALEERDQARQTARECNRRKQAVESAYMDQSGKGDWHRYAYAFLDTLKMEREKFDSALATARADALEEAAKFAETHSYSYPPESKLLTFSCRQNGLSIVADAIRARAIPAEANDTE